MSFQPMPKWRRVCGGDIWVYLQMSTRYHGQDCEEASPGEICRRITWQEQAGKESSATPNSRSAFIVLSGAFLKDE